MNDLVLIKVDNRFKDGNIRQEGNRLRGNAKTVSILPINLENAPPEIQLNPPLTVRSEMFEAMKKMGVI